MQATGANGTTREVGEEQAALSLQNSCLKSAAWGKQFQDKREVWLTVTILGFPGTEDGLMEKSKLSQGASWPEIMILQRGSRSEIAGEERKRDPGGEAWGCPLALTSFCLVPSR